MYNRSRNFCEFPESLLDSLFRSTPKKLLEDLRSRNPPLQHTYNYPAVEAARTEVSTDITIYQREKGRRGEGRGARRGGK